MIPLPTLPVQRYIKMATDINHLRRNGISKYLRCIKRYEGANNNCIIKVGLKISN